MDKRVLNYRVIIEPTKYSDGAIVYEASCPKLGVYDYGDSVEEVLESIRDGIWLAIETMAKDGQEVPVDDVEKQILTSTRINLPSGLKVSFAP